MEGYFASPDVDRDRHGDREHRDGQHRQRCGYGVDLARRSSQFGGAGDLDRLLSGERGSHAVSGRAGRSATDRAARYRPGDQKPYPIASSLVRSCGHDVRLRNRQLRRMGACDGAGRLVACNLVLRNRFPSPTAGARSPTHCCRNSLRPRLWGHVRGPVFFSRRSDRRHNAVRQRLFRHRNFQQVCEAGPS